MKITLRNPNDQIPMTNVFALRSWSLVIGIWSLATCFIIAQPSSALAADPPKDTQCRARMQSELTTVHDDYRAYLFGSRRGGSGFDVLTGGKTTTERRGIFETKGRLTSELVPPLVESYRVYRCRSIAVCGALRESFQVEGGRVTIRELGCGDTEIDRYGECYLAGAPAPPELQSIYTELSTECRTLVSDTIRAERAVLRLAVAYDTGYRSLLQFAGMMDWMLEGFDASALRAISDMVNMLGKLHQIPCFISQCDAPRPPVRQ